MNFNKIENTDGNYHVVLNIIDFALAFFYLLISLIKLKSITLWVLLINAITLVKLMIKNLKLYLDLQNEFKNEYDKNFGLQYKTPYDFKLTAEILLIFFTFIPSIIRGEFFSDLTIHNFAISVIILSFIEHLINILTDLFRAGISSKSIMN